MTKQSLDERYHCFAVLFLKSCYQAVLAQSLSNPVKAIATGFDGIYLRDSTSFQLPAHLAAFYQSNGGSTTGASVKIHQTIELLKFQLQDLSITDGKDSDGNYWQTKGSSLGKNKLWIADLGYLSWDTLTEIAQSENCFLCRYKTNTTVYTKNEQDGKYEALNIEEYIKKNGFTAATGVQSAAVYFGGEKIKARLVFERVPEEVKRERLTHCRLRHANQSKKAKRWEMTAAKAFLCGYNVYLTNAPEDKLKDEQAVLIYGLRWQIELLFKIWKSLLFIDHTKGMNIFRFECFLYGRLIFVLLSTELLSFISSTLREAAIEVEISEWKTIKLIKKNFAA